jgi:hypothetical protein
MKVYCPRLNRVIQVAKNYFVLHRAQFREFSHNIGAVFTSVWINVNHSASAARLGFTKERVSDLNFRPVIFLE